MANSTDESEYFKHELERVREAIKDSPINCYAVIVRSRRPDLNRKEIYNTFHAGRGKNKWIILRMIGELVGVEVNKPEKCVA